MEEGLSSSSSSSSAQTSTNGRVNVLLRIARTGQGSANRFEGPNEVAQFLAEVSKQKTFLKRDGLRAYRVPRDRVNVTAAESAISEADVKETWHMLVPIFDQINPDDYILVSEVSSPTGKYRSLPT